MPSSNFTPSSFRIIIDNPKPTNHPGDTITGTVFFKALEEQPIGQLLITLQGRAKTKLYRGNGQRRHPYRGRAVFFNIPLLLYKGHYTHKAGTFSWPFSFVIPTTALPTLLQGEDIWDGKENYVSSELQISTHPLPPSYRCEFTYHTSYEAFVEYKLLAQLTEPDGARRLTFERKYDAEHLLNLATISTDYPITDYPSLTKPHRLYFETLRLLPEHANGSLTFKQRMRSAFQSSTLPSFQININFSLPQVIQLNHPDPAPILISAEVLSFTIPKPTDSDSDDDAPAPPLPKILLTEFSLRIKSHTTYRTKASSLWSYEYNEYHTEDLTFANSCNVKHQIPITQDCRATWTPGPDSKAPVQSKTLDAPAYAPPPLNLTTLHGLRFPPKSEPRALAPTFRTCNIQLRHTWKLKLKISVAGETKSIDIRDLPLEILGPARFASAFADDQSMPPPPPAVQIEPETPPVYQV